jgi:UDP-N-acetyl-D-galactosamine dehydrogenase
LACWAWASRNAAAASAESDSCNANIVVAVPTPVDIAHNPDFGPLVGASATVGKHMKRGAIVVYESTVYPGATEEVCIPLLEKHSGLKWMQDFHVGFSPERINPGDKEHTLTTILKVVSGDDAETLEKVAQLYESIVKAGVHRASSIKVAEAAKVIENTQRDLNIALMNELAIIFDKIGIDTLEVLKAAGTKWNFLPFRPGLVGGHCIGVDPYYLTHKADHARLPPAGDPGRPPHQRRHGQVRGRKDRQVDDHRAGFHVKGAKVNVLGLTFKENCPDLRNSKVADIVHELSPTASTCTSTTRWPADEAQHEYGIKLDKLGRPAEGRRRSSPPCRTRKCWRPSLARLPGQAQRGGCFIDVKSQFDQNACAQPATASGACNGMPDTGRCRPVTPKVSSEQDSTAAAAPAQLPLAGHRRGRLHRLEPGRSAAAARPDGDRPRQLRHRPPHNLEQVRKLVGRSAWSRFISSRATSAPTTARAPAKASTSCCTRPRSVRCRARSPTRCSPTTTTSPVS